MRHPGEDVRWAVEGIGINCKGAEAACFGIQMKLCRTLVNTQWETHDGRPGSREACLQIVLYSPQAEFLPPLKLFSRLIVFLSSCAVFLFFYIVPSVEQRPVLLIASITVLCARHLFSKTEVPGNWRG